MRALMVAGVIALSTPASADGHIPTLMITGQLGFNMTPGVQDPNSVFSPDPELNFILGLRGTLNKSTQNAAFYADGQALFLGNAYIARGGVVLGKGLGGSYSEISNISTSYDYNTNKTTTTVTGTSYSQKVHSVLGLHLSGEVGALDGASAAILGAGFGLRGQMIISVDGLYDVINGAPGIRTEFSYMVGDRDFALPIRIELQAFFDFEDHPMPLMLSFGIGWGNGFRW